MFRWKMRIRKLSYLLVDILSVLSVFTFSKWLFESLLQKNIRLTSFEFLSLVMLFLMFMLLLFLILSIYEETIEHQGSINIKVALKMLISIVVTNVLIVFLLYRMEIQMYWNFLFYNSLMIIAFFIINRYIMKYIIAYSFQEKSLRNILIVGHSYRGIQYIEEINKHKYLNFHIMGYVSIKEDAEYEGIPTLGTIEQLPDIVINCVIDEIAVAKSLAYDDRLSDILSQCQQMGITITMLLETKNKDSRAQVAMIGDLPVLKFHTVSLNESQLFAKRVLDVVGSIFGILIFACAYLIIGPLIKIESKGPIIFKQERVGKNGRIFKVLKFRSMGVNAEKEIKNLLQENEISGHMFKMTNDPRITKVGNFIRKTSIDELPQFINVFIGDMSLVGTRPPTLNEVREYEIHHRKRISMTPGITGNWQVSGRSDIKNFEEVVKLDEDYIKDWTIWKDIKILLKTIKVVLFRIGSK